MSTVINGKVFKYGDNIDTDVIIPARYLSRYDASSLAAHCMEDIDRDFAACVTAGDVIVAGKNFGCGSSREHAPLALKASGISCVIAESFARIFYRNAINIGLAIIESGQAAKSIKKGDIVEIDFNSGLITDKSNSETYNAEPFPDFICEIINSGGLLNRAKDENVNL